MTKILDGRPLAQKIKEQLMEQVNVLTRKPGLAIILAGNHEASQIYVDRKCRVADKLGITTRVERLSEDVTLADIQALIAAMNTDDQIDGILLQLPLPTHLEAQLVLDSIAVNKDVDGLTSASMGKLLTNQPGIRPATPMAVMTLLNEYQIPMAGRKALVIGRSQLVGKPLSLLLLAEQATVTVAHSQTSNLSELVAQSDIIISATGRAGLIQPAMVNPASVFIDVGISRLNQQIVGDISAEAKQLAHSASPVPGGVGPLTIACLFQNLLECYRLQRSELVGVDELA